MAPPTGGQARVVRAERREDVFRRAAEQGVDLDARIEFVIQALEGVGPKLGLAGPAA
ncbi:MAG: hypothetical protein HYW16_01890 [Candidatus Rokubacteria bacterium]|nr:hypothetical protein [Candidatus Rokubacteria bacterium]